MSLYRLVGVGLLISVLALCGCSSSSSSSSSLPSQGGNARVRFVEGAPDLETLIGSEPTDIGLAYLQVNGKTVASTFDYGDFTPFLSVNAGTLSLVARDEAGYAVGPLKSTALSPSKSYTLIVVGTYPTYSVLTFAEPSNGTGAAMSLYEASPAVPQANFGSFQASSYSNLKQLGSATLGNVTTVGLGKQVSNLGGYASTTSCPTPPTPPNCLTLKQIDSFDSKNDLPFHNATRLSLFLLDPKPGNPSGSPGPLFGSLDK
jgi:hypothetical protein